MMIASMEHNDDAFSSFVEGAVLGLLLGSWLPPSPASVAIFISQLIGITSLAHQKWIPKIGFILN